MYGFLFLVLCVFAIYISDKLILKSSKYVYTSVGNIPYNKVGLVLGTSKFLKNNHVNLYYKYRVNATVNLYKSKKIDYVLISGDNSTKDYNEPADFKSDLIKLGIPEEKIVLDYAGFRTFDSVIRSREVFSQNSITIISQKFHNERAVFIARKNNINAIGYNAKDVSRHYGFKTMFREKFARVKTILDIYLLKTRPRFLGKKIKIGL
ncbi:MAG: ElyC/SanA/YdcF family protein [Bacteroidota bacterium]